VLTTDDCDDEDGDLMAIALDGDCDGVLTVDDCDDEDPGVVAETGDCVHACNVSDEVGAFGSGSPRSNNLRGNWLYADTDGVLTDFSMNFELEATCDVGFFVYSSDTNFRDSDISEVDADDLTLEWSNMVTAGSVEGMVNSDDIGIDIVAGTWYNLMVGWDCEAETGLVEYGESTWALGTTEGLMADNSYGGYDGFDHAFGYPYEPGAYHQVVNTEVECETDIAWDFTATASPDCDADFTMLGSDYTGDCEDCTFSFDLDTAAPLGEAIDCGLPYGWLPGWMDFSDEAISDRVLKHYDTFEHYGYEWTDVLLVDYVENYYSEWSGSTYSLERKNFISADEGIYATYYTMFGEPEGYVKYYGFIGPSTFELSEAGFDFSGEGESYYSAYYGSPVTTTVESSATFY
jgi:hypothetical protein